MLSDRQKLLLADTNISSILYNSCNTYYLTVFLYLVYHLPSLCTDWTHLPSLSPICTQLCSPYSICSGYNLCSLLFPVLHMPCDIFSSIQSLISLISFTVLFRTFLTRIFPYIFVLFQVSFASFISLFMFLA